MGEVHIQNHREEPVSVTPSTSHQQKQQQLQPILIQSSMLDDLHHNQQQEQPVIDHSTDLLSMLHLNGNSNRHRHPLRTTKRRSPPSSSERSAKKHLHNQEDLTNHGFSSISLPLTLRRNGPFLRRCVSDRYNPPQPPRREPGLPPLPSKFTRSFSDVTPTPVRASPRSLSSEEATPDSLRLKRMKDKLSEMKQLCDEMMKEEEGGGGEEEEVEKEQQQQQQQQQQYSPLAEKARVLSQDELGGDCEEIVSVEWVDKCVSLTFRCPCGKGYEVIISANNCYYKLL